MSMLRKLGVVTGVALFAVSAMATNFRAADQVYVPAAGHVTGSDGSTFITDLVVSNVTTDSVTVSVIFASASGGVGTTIPACPATPACTATNLFTLGAGERREFIDFVGTPIAQGGLGLGAAFGQVVFNGCKSGSSCGSDTQDSNGVSPNFRAISVETRTFSIPPGTVIASNPPTKGQLFSGYPWYNYVSQDQAANGLDKVFLVGIRQSTFYRTNIGFVNASQFSNTDIVVKLYNGNNSSTPLGTKTTSIGPLGFFQQSLSSMFGGVTFPGTFSSLYVTVEQQNSSSISSDPSVVPAGCQPGGCPGFYAYGSVLDNQTTDATTLEPQYTKQLTDAQINCLYPAPSTAPCKSVSPVHRAARH